jgi:3'-5' exoribonuclease
MKDFYVEDAPRYENAIVTSYFLLSSVSVRDKRGSSEQYLALTVADRSGSLEARMWDDVASAVSTCAEGCYVKVMGQVSKYNGRFQITIAKMRLASDSEIDPADFVPTSKYNVDEMWGELRGYVEGFANPDLRRLVFVFLDDPEIGPAYRTAPAAKVLHHAWIGGLLEHVLTLVRVCRAAAPFYPEVDPDLLVTGAILHDIGKIRELSWKSSFSYTLEGQMIGHICIAQTMLRDKVAGLSDFPERLRILIEHMILSHHGKYEFGSPKLPMTPEALLLSALDDLEAKMQAMRNEFARNAAAGKSGAEMTDWVRSMERPFLNSQAFLEGPLTMRSPAEEKIKAAPELVPTSEEVTESSFEG